jgi:hypothetical protein
MTDTELFNGDGEPTEAARPTTRQARAARDAALDQVDEHADQLYKDAAALAIATLARERAEFTADDVRETIPEGVTTHDTRALGPIFLAAARAGIIVRTERTVPSRYRHATQMRVWRSGRIPEASTWTADPAAAQAERDALLVELETENTALRAEVERLSVELVRVRARKENQKRRARRWQRKYEKLVGGSDARAHHLPEL